jgi:hypothetical protein
VIVHHHEWTRGDSEYHWAHAGPGEECEGMTINGEPIPVTGVCPDGRCDGYNAAWFRP